MYRMIPFSRIKHYFDEKFRKNTSNFLRHIRRESIVYDVLHDFHHLRFSILLDNHRAREKAIPRILEKNARVESSNSGNGRINLKHVY